MTHIHDQITDDRRTALDGFGQLTDMFFDIPQMPMPQRISHCVLAEDDETGITIVTRLAEICEQNEVPCRRTNTDCKYAITITFNSIAYEIFYVYQNEMRRYRAEMSYQDNLRASFSDLEGEC